MSLQEIRISILTLTVVLGLVFVLTGAAAAQSVVGDPEHLNFEVINVTSGTPGEIERLTLQYATGPLRPVFDVKPRGSVFPMDDVPVRRSGRYILTAYAQGVPYYWSLRGSDLLVDPVRLHIFDTVSGLDEVSIVGMDLLIRKTESLLELEYMLHVENLVRPQATVVGSPAVRLVLPADARSASVSYGNGPEKEELELTGLSGGAELSVPLTTGRNPIRVKTTIPWSEGISLDVGANVPIRSWSLMATPSNLDIQAFDLVPADVAGLSDHVRFKGPQVAADKIFSFRMSSTAGAGEEEKLFTHDPSDESAETAEVAGEEKDESRGFPFVVLTPIFVVVIVLIVRRRRRK